MDDAQRAAEIAELERVYNGQVDEARTAKDVVTEKAQRLEALRGREADIEAARRSTEGGSYAVEQGRHVVNKAQIRRAEKQLAAAREKAAAAANRAQMTYDELNRMKGLK